MIPNRPKFVFGGLSLGSETVRVGWDALSTLNSALDGVKKVANDVANFGSGSGGGGEEEQIGPRNQRRGALARVEVGQVYGRMRNDLRLMQVFESNETRSMGALEIVSVSNSVDFSRLSVRWRRKLGDRMVDVGGGGGDDSLAHELTADDVGSTIIVEIFPKEEGANTLNITYGEFGPIEMDETTKIALSKSLKTGQIRFPVQIVWDELDGLSSPYNVSRESGGGESFSSGTRDILVVTNDDVRVIKNGMSSCSSSFEKSLEWSAKYFGGNIHVILSNSSMKEFTLCSGFDTHRQRISVKATSRSARDIAALTIRCLSIRHSISLEAIIGGGLFWDLDRGDGYQSSGKLETDSGKRMSVLAYMGRLENEIADLENGRERLNEDKRLLQREKALLENELAETISAYQDIIAQYQKERETQTGTGSSSAPHSRDCRLPHRQAGELDAENLQDTGGLNLGLVTARQTSQSQGGTNPSLLHGYSGTYPSRHVETGSHGGDQSHQAQTEIKRLQEENASLKLSISQLKSEKEHEVGAKEAMERMHAEIEELRGRLERSDREKEDLKRLAEKHEREVLIKSQELENARFGQSMEEVSKVQSRILELQSQNSEKQQAIQTLSTEKSRLLRDFSGLKLDFEKLKEQHNQLNKRFVSLSMEHSRETRPCGSSEKAGTSVSPSPGNEEISKLRAELEDTKKANTELHQTVAQLKSRIRRLAMIHSS
ncbi:putative coiled coil protein [Cryptosporidium canis]|uniref:Coiled coil protein n=1 Tax=Cryptosporidium canis TaxID=195482 RepID=A0A9D5HYP6_9CRYT|nr:putative coiled coil protein [Cryptosporidium canis]